jgi:hypothetical protein
MDGVFWWGRPGRRVSQSGGRASRTRRYAVAAKQRPSLTRARQIAEQKYGRDGETALNRTEKRCFPVRLEAVFPSRP